LTGHGIEDLDRRGGRNRYTKTVATANIEPLRISCPSPRSVRGELRANVSVELTGANAIRNVFILVLNRRGDMKKLTAFIKDWIISTANAKYRVIAEAGFKRFPRIR